MCAFKREVDFGVDNFNKPIVYSESESLAKILINLLLMKPGNLPGLPHLGIDISQYLYGFEDEINLDELKSKIYSQASEMLPYFVSGSIKLALRTIEGESVLVVGVPITTDKGSDAVYLGFAKGTNGELLTNYQFGNS